MTFCWKESGNALGVLWHQVQEVVLATPHLLVPYVGIR